MTRIGDETVNSFAHGRISGIGTTAVSLTATAAALAKGVQVRAGDGNTAIVYVGNSNVTTDTADATDGYPLDAGESLFVPVNDPRKVYVRSTAASQKVYWFAI